MKQPPAQYVYSTGAEQSATLNAQPSKQRKSGRRAAAKARPGLFRAGKELDSIARRN